MSHTPTVLKPVPKQATPARQPVRPTANAQVLRAAPTASTESEAPEEWEATEMAVGASGTFTLALESVRGVPNYQLIGRNLMAHLRSNLTIRIPRAALPSGLPAALDAGWRVEALPLFPLEMWLRRGGGV